MKYAELLDYRKQYAELEKGVRERLVTGINDLRMVLLTEMNMPESSPDSEGRRWRHIVIREPDQDQGAARELPFAEDIVLTSSGAVAFVLEINLISDTEVYPIWIYLGAKDSGNSTFFALWDVPGAYQEKPKNWRSMEGIIREIDLELAKYFAHNPASGDRHNTSIV